MRASHLSPSLNEKPSYIHMALQSLSFIIRRQRPGRQTYHRDGPLWVWWYCCCPFSTSIEFRLRPCTTVDSAYPWDIRGVRSVWFLSSNHALGDATMIVFRSPEIVKHRTERQNDANVNMKPPSVHDRESLSISSSHLLLTLLSQAAFRALVEENVKVNVVRLFKSQTIIDVRVHIVRHFRTNHQ